MATPTKGTVRITFKYAGRPIHGAACQLNGEKLETPAGSALRP
jgi:hypothetical protein